MMRVNVDVSKEPNRPPEILISVLGALKVVGVIASIRGVALIDRLEEQ